MLKKIFIGFTVTGSLFLSPFITYGGTNVNEVQLFKAPKFTKDKNLIENLYNQRLARYGIKLTQFGYNFFNKPLNPQSILLPVDESYTLGPGDELIIYLIGLPPDVNLPPVIKTVVDREGKIYIPNFGVFYVWGLSLGEVQKILSKSLGAQVKLTVGRLRTFPVYVSGEVNKPGAVIVTAVNTVLDALSLAGGVSKTGTLRNIVINRRTPEGLKTIHIDLYNLLIKGKPIDIKVREGDVILVPPIGSTCAIAGGVKRPAIYELKGNETIKDVINLAGGVLPSTYKYRVIVERYSQNKLLKVLQGDLDNSTFLSQRVKDGDLIILKEIVNIPENAYALEGYIAYPGIYQYKQGLTLKDILNKNLLLKDTNTKFAVIIRQYPKGSLPAYIAFSPEKVLEGLENYSIQPQDRIVFFKYGPIKGINLSLIKNRINIKGYYKYTGPVAYEKGLTLKDILKENLLLPDTNLSFAEIERYNPKTLQREKIIKFKPIDILENKTNIPLKPLDTIVLYPKYVFKPIKVSGLVVQNKWITYQPGMTLAEALATVKFKTDVTKLKAIVKTDNKVTIIYLAKLLKEKDPTANISLKPGAEIVIKPISKDEIVSKVTVNGYVWRPGVYKIGEKTTLYDVLKAAGGFRPEAYPEGIVILRKSIARMQRERLQQAITLMQETLNKEEAGIMQADISKEQMQAYQYAFEAKRRLLQQMLKTQVTGRIVGLKIPKNLEALKYSPSNIVLEDGDQIYVPKVPSAVLVFGEVYNPSAIVYKPGLTVKDYIQLAGGLTKYADVENIFVIKANGIAVSSQTNKSLIEWDSQRKRFIWGRAYNDILDYKLQPGDAIIVPTKIKVPIFWRPLIKDVVQIIYQSALTVYTISKL